MAFTNLWLISAVLSIGYQEPKQYSGADSGIVHLHTPDAIAAAVLPYLSCLYASHGLPFLSDADGRPTTSKYAPGSNCTAARREANDAALAVLKMVPPTDGRAPEAVVEEALQSMDSYVAELSARRSAANWGNLPAVSGSMIMIEDEVLPAYKIYNDCLRSKTLETPVTSANVMGKFRLALITCRTVKASSIQTATEALGAKGWELGRRRRVAANTFEKADQSWNSLGRRLYQALIRRDHPGASIKKSTRAHR